MFENANQQSETRTSVQGAAEDAKHYFRKRGRLLSCSFEYFSNGCPEKDFIQLILCLQW